MKDVALRSFLAVVMLVLSNVRSSLSLGFRAPFSGSSRTLQRFRTATSFNGNGRLSLSSSVNDLATSESSGASTYDFKRVEERWQKYWDDNETFKTVRLPAISEALVFSFFLTLAPTSTPCSFLWFHDLPSLTDVAAHYDRSIDRIQIARA